jgi:uncharacterized membrane protein YphA (DoxX/SURF4 family)
MTPEKDIQNAIITYLRALGHLVIRLPLGPMLISRGAQKIYKKHPLSGFPDLFGVMRGGRGRMFAIEVKSEKGKTSDLQNLWLAQLEKFGVVTMVARSVEDVIKRFKEEEERWKITKSG